MTRLFQLFASLLICCAAAPLASPAQQGGTKYHEEAELIRKEMWSRDMPEFKKRDIPAGYLNSSKVIIARRLEVNADSKKKIAFRFGLAAYRELTLTEVLREAVKINDKSALSDYSEISYTQLEKKNGFLMDRTTVVYLGIRVTKPDGSSREINADDIVLTKDMKQQKEAKIAVPDLQVGDIIDYFIARQTNMSQIEELPPYLFTFYDEAPVMHTSMHFEIGKKYAIEYRSYNGAPDFKVTKGEDDDNILDVVKTNIAPVTENDLWTAPFRQLPMIRLNILLGNKGLFAKKLNLRKPGELYRNQESDEYLEDRLRIIAVRRSLSRATFDMGKVSGEYLKTIRKNRSRMSADSLARELFYVFRFHNFLEQNKEEKIADLLALPQITLNEDIVTFYLGEFLKSENVENSLVYSSSNKGPRLKEILSPSDLNNIIMVGSGKNSFYGFSNIFTTPAYTPSYFENIKNAITVDTRGPRETNARNFVQGATNIKPSKPDDNRRIETIEADISPENGYLQVKRTSTVTGHYKTQEQQRLILFEDYYEHERKKFNDDKSLIERLSEGRKTKSYAAELEAAFEEARKKNKESFLEEAVNFFDTEIKDMDKWKVNKLGVRHTDPDLVYSSEFKIGGVVKKAGASYVIDIGKLQGAQLKIGESQRERTLDIYAPFPRSLRYNIRLAIPEGFAAEGVDALNKKVENSTGSFVCEAKADDKILVIQIVKTYANDYEPASNWKKMLEFIDAANEWTSARVVLRKK